MKAGPFIGDIGEASGTPPAPSLIGGKTSAHGRVCAEIATVDGDRGHGPLGRIESSGGMVC